MKIISRSIILFLSCLIISCGEDICSCIEISGEDNPKLKECIGDVDEEELKYIIKDCSEEKIIEETEFHEHDDAIETTLETIEQDGLQDPGEPSLEDSH